MSLLLLFLNKNLHVRVRVRVCNAVGVSSSIDRQFPIGSQGARGPSSIVHCLALQGERELEGES
jgi:hypothetical protein